uniref:Polyprotein n=1 Tax=Taenia asiatica TaxID=60517 RepID=A0A0R3WHC4_TAEAS
LADLCPPGDGDPKISSMAFNAVSDHVSATIILSTPPPLPINYVTVKPDCWSCPTLYIATQVPTRRIQDSKGSDGESDGPNNELCCAAYGKFEVTPQSTKTGLCYISRGLVAHGKVDIKGKVYDCLITIARRFLPPMAFMLTRACIGPSNK